MNPKNHESARDLYFKATAEPVGTPSKRRIPAYTTKDMQKKDAKQVIKGKLYKGKLY